MADVLLIATVGGSPEALVSGILAAKPARVIFVCSTDTRKSISSGDEARPGIVERLARERYVLDSGRYDAFEIPDPQDLTSAVEHIHREATPSVERWRSRGPGFEVVADFTGGTKCMSMALGLVARSWPCLRPGRCGGRRRMDRTGPQLSRGRAVEKRAYRPASVPGSLCMLGPVRSWRRAAQRQDVCQTRLPAGAPIQQRPHCEVARPRGAIRRIPALARPAGRRH